MARSVSPKRAVKPARPSYILDEQIGFILRQVWQRHATIFAREIGINLTPTQWAALAKLTETGPCSQNLLGRLTAMDVATIKGVIDRLTARGLDRDQPGPRGRPPPAGKPDARRPATGGESRAERARDHARDAGAARCEGARDADGAVGQVALKDARPRQVRLSTSAIAPTRMRLTAQIVSRLNQLCEMNLRPR